MRKVSARVNIAQLLAAAPALIAIAFGMLVFKGTGSRARSNLQWCETTATIAEDNSDYKTASVCYARLLQAKPHDQETAFKLAESLQAIGQPENARTIMSRLADSGDGGYLPAHIWLARQILDDAHASNDLLTSATKHLLAAFQNQPDDSEVNYLLAVSYARRGLWDRVDGYAAKASDRILSLKQMLRQIANAQGNRAAAGEWE
jgi:Flp pilus assembly protein TadD